MDQDNKPKATVVKTFTLTGLELRLTEKGAVVVYLTADGREPRFSHCLSPSHVKIHAEMGCPVFSSIIEDAAWLSIQENREVNKEKAKIEKQVARQMDKAAKTIQAAKDQLRALGLDPETVFKKQA